MRQLTERRVSEDRRRELDGGDLAIPDPRPALNTHLVRARLLQFAQTEADLVLGQHSGEGRGLFQVVFVHEAPDNLVAGQRSVRQGRLPRDDGRDVVDVADDQLMLQLRRLLRHHGN